MRNLSINLRRFRAGRGRKSAILRKYAILRRTRRHKVTLAKVRGKRLPHYFLLAQFYTLRGAARAAWVGRQKSRACEIYESPSRARAHAGRYVCISHGDTERGAASKSSDASPLRIIPANRNAFIAPRQLFRRAWEEDYVKRPASGMHAIEVKWVKTLRARASTCVKWQNVLNEVSTKALNEPSYYFRHGLSPF